MSQLSCLGRRGTGHSGLLSISQQSLRLRGAGVTLSLGYEWILLPVCSEGMLHSLVLALLWGWSALLSTSWLKHHWTARLSGVVVSPSSKMGLENALHRGWGCDSSSCLNMAKLGLRTSKTLHLKILIRQIYTPPSSLVKVHPQLGSAGEQILWLGLLTKHHRCELNLVGFYKPLPPSPSESDSQGLSPTDSPAIPVVQDQSRCSFKVTHNAGEGLFVPSWFSFPTGETRGSRETTLHGVALAWGRGNVVNL